MAAKLGSGARFKALSAELGARGAHNPDALAAHIGRKRYGKAKFTAMAAKARSRKGGGMHRARYEDWIRPVVPLEDIHIMSRAEGDGSGTTVEAYATVFDQPTPIEDHQGKYTEIIDRGAFDAALAQIRLSRGGLAGSVKVLFNHGRTIGGQEAPEFQLPIGVPLDIRPETRGLLTRTKFDAGDPFTERILSKIRSGAINTYSFVGGIIRSDPQLRGPGDRYRESNGVRPTVRRMILGLREYGPVIWAAYPGAEVLGVRTGSPEMYGSFEDVIVTDDELSEVEEFTPGMEGDDTGGTPEEVHPTRDHAHRLYALRTEQMCREAGISALKGGF